MAQVRVGIVVKEWRNKDDSRQSFQCNIPRNLGMCSVLQESSKRLISYCQHELLTT